MINSLFQLKNIVLATLFCLSGPLASAQTNLSKAEAATLAATELQAKLAIQKPKAEAEWAAKQIQFKNYTMKFTTKIFGDKPADGRSLYISLHGGGGTTAKVNNQQWENQKRLYKLKEGVYFVPRAPVDAWNMWHDYPMDELLAEVVKSEIVMDDVNPNKIYVMGYSAGGDGVFQLAPRLADYWGAAAMMAGHPGDAQILNLKNLPFDAFVGSVDSAYHRNELVAQWGRRLDSLQKAYPGNFIHETHVYEGLPHWMNRKDTTAIDWLPTFRRNPIPSDVIWIQDDILRDQFYWLGTDVAIAKQGQKVRVKRTGNNINVVDNQDEVLYIYLNDDMLNLDKKITVSINGKKVFNQKVARNADIIKQTAAARLDKGLVFSAKLMLKNGQVSSL